MILLKQTIYSVKRKSNIINNYLLFLMIFISLYYSYIYSTPELDINVDLALAESFYNESDFERAITFYKKYYLLNKSEISSNELSYAVFKIGLCYQNLKDYNIAMRYFYNVININADTQWEINAKFQMGFTKYLAGMYDFAYQDFTAFQSEFPHSSHYSDLTGYLKGYTFILKADWENAKKTFDRLINQNPQTPFLEPAKKISEECANAVNMSYKSPVLAGIFSALIPGTGQMYSGRVKDGIDGFLYPSVFGTITAYAYREESKKDKKNYFFTAFFGTLATLFYISNVQGAVNAAQNYNIIAKRNKIQELLHTYVAVSLSYSPYSNTPTIEYKKKF